MTSLPGTGFKKGNNTVINREIRSTSHDNSWPDGSPC